MLTNCSFKRSTSHQATWSAESTLATDLSFHQIAPYIGRMKTSMARVLIDSTTRKGDLVVDPFCGCGVVALEAAANGRRVVVGDCNPYGVVLTQAKLFPPRSLHVAEEHLHEIWELSRKRVLDQDLRLVPAWVRSFFHPETLRDALAFRDTCVDLQEHFMLGCLLGILHHQRPGFLSHPSSHLVPYLRDKKFPRDRFPSLYERRDVLRRLEAKLQRTFRRPPRMYAESRRVIQVDARNFPRIRGIHAVITSPPYMNELDYVRDNRLRLWFLQRSLPDGAQIPGRYSERDFTELMRNVCTRLAPCIEKRGYFVLVLGGSMHESTKKKSPASLTRSLFDTEAKLRSFELTTSYVDAIPDIRRSRKECRSTKLETILVYRKARI